MNRSQVAKDSADTAHGTCTPANRCQFAKDTAHATQRTERAHRWTGAKWPRTPHTQHTGEQEQGVILVSICGGDIGEVTHTPHFCKKKPTKVPECTQCTMVVKRYTAEAKFKSTSELLVT